MTEPIEPGTAISCQQLVELITDYLEGQLDEATRAELDAHLALCEGCAEYLRQMGTTIQTLGHVPLDTLSDTAKADLMAAFRGYPTRGGA